MAKQTEIYIGANEIQAVAYSGSGRVTIAGYYTSPLPDGCMINGLIINEEAFNDAVAEFVSGCRFKLNKARLLVDSSQIMLKSLPLPEKMQKKQILYAVRAELSSLDNKKEYIYGYGEIRPRREGVSRDILCSGFEKELAEKYKNAFERVGVKLNAIHVVPGSIMHMVERIPALCEGTIILCVLDGQNAVTYLFANGCYIMHSRNRLLTKRGDEKITGELLGRISTMNQFSQSQKDFEKTSKVYFCGLDENERKGCHVVTDTFQLEAEAYSLEGLFKLSKAVTELPYDTLFNVLAAILPSKRRDVDFLAAEKEASVDTLEKKGHPGLFITALVATAVIMLAVWGVVLYGNLKIYREVKEIQQFTEDPGNLAEYQKALGLQDRIRQYQSAAGQIRSADTIIASTKQPDAQMLYSIEATAGAIECADYQYSLESEQLTFNCLAPDYHSIPGFIRALKASGFFRGVSYSGYAYDENAGGYRFTVTGRIAKPETAEGGEQ